MDHHEKVIRRLEDFILAERNLKSVGNIPFEHDGKRELGYPYIRASNRSFENALGELEWLLEKPVKDILFLEVGCGIGTKCEIARLIGMEASGIDILPEYINLAQMIYPDCTFLHANAFEYNYNRFDAVYYGVPFFDDYLIQQLEDRVLSQLPFGAVLIVTRISEALAKMLGEDATSQHGYSVHRLTVEEDIGRLVVEQKC